MGNDLAKNLSKTAGFSGSQDNLKDFLIEIMDSGATDIILVPTSKNIDQLLMAEEVASQLT